MSRLPKAQRPVPPRTALAKTIEMLSDRYRPEQVFCDFVEMSALAISNAVDKAQFDGREQRYMDIVRRYRPDEVTLIKDTFHLLVDAMEDDPFADTLGGLFNELELNN